MAGFADGYVLTMCREATLTDLPECDLLLVMGTSLQVQPFASLIGAIFLTFRRVAR